MSACDDERPLTVEVNPRTGRVVQARGVCNRLATADEWRIVDAWASAVVRGGSNGGRPSHRSLVRAQAGG